MHFINICAIIYVQDAYKYTLLNLKKTKLVIKHRLRLRLQVNATSQCKYIYLNSKAQFLFSINTYEHNYNVTNIHVNNKTKMELLQKLF